MNVGDILAKGPPYPGGREYVLRLPKPREEKRELPVWVREKIARDKVKKRTQSTTDQPTLF